MWYTVSTVGENSYKPIFLVKPLIFKIIPPNFFNETDSRENISGLTNGIIKNILLIFDSVSSIIAVTDKNIAAIRNFSSKVEWVLSAERRDILRYSRTVIFPSHKCLGQ